MRAAEDIEDLVQKANCQAPDALRRRLWEDVAQELHRSQDMTERRGETRVWRILMNSKMARLAVAAVVVVAALAVGVERLTRSKPNTVQAFSAKIQANMALDLDPEAALPLREAQPEDFDVTWSSEDGGSLQILPGSSVRILACPYIDPEWDSAVSWSYSKLAELKESTVTRVVPTKREPFVAVLTSEGNLAVIRIGGHKETHAWLSWRVEKPVAPAYGPIQTVTLRIVDPQGADAEDGAVDLDTGQILSMPTDVLTLSAAEMLAWLEENGIDAIARKTDEGYGLIGVGLVFWTWSPGSWAGDDALEVRQDMAAASFQPRRPLLYQEGQYQYVFPFRTREGGIGMLQMVAVDTAAGTLEFRYRMVQDEPVTPVDTAEGEDLESQQLAESLKKLMRFGLVAWKYAEEHDWRYPDTLEQLPEYAERCGQDFQWILDNVGYVGAGRTAEDPESTLIAYDKTLLATGKGTYGVFRDGHAEFIEPERLSEYGLSAEP
ncbi:MAG: hypothetical protein JSW27_04680 [Phycisphaerales bacterium]|nr:MAG: hypothetical protein JSW27_04680 [Phycisphaerales bacterium]